MFRIQFKQYFFLIQCLIFSQNIFVMTISGPSVRSAYEGEFPAAVSIVKDFRVYVFSMEIYHTCSGTLVSTQDVITVEHCLRGTFTQGFKILAGSIDLAKSLQFFPIFIWTYEHWIKFKQRSLPSPNNDIAFIKLSENIPRYIQFSPFGNIGNEHLYGLDVISAGWGIFENGTMPGILQVAKVQVLSYRDCEKQYYTLKGSRINLDEKFICSMADPYVILTDGDSGGPVFFFGTLVAINKGVSPPSNGTIHPDFINIHMSLRSYQDFFQDILTTFHMNF